MSDKSPTVTVVVPTHNYGRYLEQSVQSALAQAYRGLEVLIVDDGSTDDTTSILEKLKADPRVRCVRQERRGPAAARNRALAESFGTYVAMLDADDVWLPDKLERQLAVLDADPEVGVVYTNSLTMGLPGEPSRLHFDGTTYHHPHVGWVLPHLALHNYVTTSTVVARRMALEEAGCYDESLQVCEDWDLWLRIATRWRLAYVDAPLARVRRHGSNTHMQADLMLRDSFRVLERVPRYAGGWAKLGPRARERAYARAHLRAATTLYVADQPLRALGHLGRAACYDPLCISHHELRQAASCLAVLARLKPPLSARRAPQRAA